MSLSVKTQGGSVGMNASIFVTGLSKSDTVTATKDGKTVNSKWVQKDNPNYVGLPEGYTQLESISSSGVEYIDTGYTINANTDVELCIDVTNAQTDGCSIFGSRPTYGSNMFVIFAAKDAIGLNYGSKDFAAIKNGITGEVVVKKEDLNFFVNGELCATATNTPSSISPTAHIFNAYDRGLQSLYCNGVKLKYLKIAEGGVLKKDFIPCVNPAGEVGVYDMVDGVFHGNASGNGELIAGAEVPATIGYHIIEPIKDYGMWTVTATDGGYTATRDVLVDAAVEYEIEMSYRLWLFREGEGSLVGDWTTLKRNATTSNNVIVTSNSIDLVVTAAAYNELGTYSPLVDISSLETLNINYTNTNGTLVLGVSKNTATTMDGLVIVDYCTVFEATSDVSTVQKTLTLDVSALSGEYYIFIFKVDTSTGGHTTKVYDVWGE